MAINWLRSFEAEAAQAAFDTAIKNRQIFYEAWYARGVSADASRKYRQ